MLERYDPDLLLGYIENDLDSEDRARIEQMMADDPQLSALLQALESDRSLLRSISEEQAPAGLVDDAMHQLERSMLLDSQAKRDADPIPIQRGRDLSSPASNGRMGRALGLAGLAAAIAIGVGVTFFASQGDPLNQTAMDLAADGDSQPVTPDQSSGDPARPASVPNRTAGDAERDGRGTLLRRESSRPRPAAAAESRDPEAGDTRATASDRTAESDKSTNSGQGLLDRVTDAILNGPLADEDSAPAGNRPEEVNRPAAFTPAIDSTTRSPVVALASNNDFLDNPPPQFFVLSESPDRTRQQIVEWCIANGVPVVETQGLEFAYDTDVQSLGKQDANQLAIPGNLALLIEPEQLDELNAFVNANQETSPSIRQRALVNRVADSPKQRSAIRDLRSGQIEDQSGSVLANTYTQIKVPSDLGNDQQTRMNASNTLDYNNRIAMEGTVTPPPGIAGIAAVEPAAAAGGEPAQPSESEAQIRLEFQRESTEGLAEDENAPAPTRSADATTPAPGTPAPGQIEAEREEISPDEQASRAAPRTQAAQSDDSSGEQADDVDVDADLQFKDASARPANRGNWLMPQLPLVKPTPLWPPTPETRLVPLVLRRGSPLDVNQASADVDADDGQAVEADNESVDPVESDPDPDAATDDDAGQ